MADARHRKQLQFGHAGEGVETQRAESLRSEGIALQFGHAGEGVETPRRTAQRYTI